MRRRLLIITALLRLVNSLKIHGNSCYLNKSQAFDRSPRTSSVAPLALYLVELKLVYDHISSTTFQTPLISVKRERNNKSFEHSISLRIDFNSNPGRYGRSIMESGRTPSLLLLTLIALVHTIEYGVSSTCVISKFPEDKCVTILSTRLADHCCK